MKRFILLALPVRGIFIREVHLGEHRDAAMECVRRFWAVDADGRAPLLAKDL